MHYKRSVVFFLAQYPVRYWYFGLMIFIAVLGAGWFWCVHTYIEKTAMMYEKQVAELQEKEHAVELLQKELKSVGMQTPVVQEQHNKAGAVDVWDKHVSQLFAAIAQVKLTLISAKTAVVPIKNEYEKHLVHVIACGALKQLVLFFDLIQKDTYVFNIDGIEISVDQHNVWRVQFDCWTVAAKKDKKSLQLNNKLKG
jgi:hypothetical protein